MKPKKNARPVPQQPDPEVAAFLNGLVHCFKRVWTATHVRHSKLIAEVVRRQKQTEKELRHIAKRVEEVTSMVGRSKLIAEVVRRQKQTEKELQYIAKRVEQVTSMVQKDQGEQLYKLEELSGFIDLVKRAVEQPPDSGGRKPKGS